MEGLKVVELIGTISFFVFSFACAYISINVHRFTRYGQEALLAAAAALFTAGVMRSLVYVGWLSREEAAVANSVAAISFVLIGLQLAALRYFNHHYTPDRRRSR